MLVLSAAEMEACDRSTTERFGIPSTDLMRSAAMAIARVIRIHFPTAQRITVLAGRGNNGGDGMMAARLLSAEGLEVRTLLLGAPSGLKGDAALAWGELYQAERTQAHTVTRADDLARFDVLLNTDLIVDAVLGTGFKPPMRGLALATLDWLRKATAPILAVDLPSGWEADALTAEHEQPYYPADAVVTFTAPKPAHVFGHLTRHWDQPIVVAPIGSPDEIVTSSLSLEWSGTAMDMVQRPRSTAANKGNFGHVLVVGGTMGTAGGMAGAPAMSAMSALRSGAGLVTAAVPLPAIHAVATLAPENMTLPLDATPGGQIAASNLAPERMQKMLAGKTVLAIGPGMGQDDETGEFLIGLLEQSKLPAVLDADALNLLARHPGILPHLGEGRTLVLTPHPGEMSRLTGLPIEEIQANRLQVARLFAWNNRVTLVLKGARTVIAHPDGRVAINTTGNPGMAKAGSGDILTGLVAGLLAQHPDSPEHAVEAAVYLHGLAADLCVRSTDEHTLLATDTLREFSRAFRFRWRGPNGYGWLQGQPAPSPLHEVAP